MKYKVELPVFFDKNMDFIENLRQRSLIQDISNIEELSKLDHGSSFYVGFDPTAPSLQIGNLVPLLVSIQLAKFGLKPIILFGGATGMIGDPSGKSAERPLLPVSEIEQNVNFQSLQVKTIFQRLNLDCQIVNNLDWTKNISFIDFLRDYGKYLTVNYMISKDVIKNRLSDPGISYTEFSYMLLQALDFAHLYEKYNCRLQIGGSDQWGNITAGLELIRKKLNGSALAFSIPLITNSAGKKFGKSEQGAIWLDPTRTSPYQLHQFLFNVDDKDVIKLLKCLTLLDLKEIQAVEVELQNAAQNRTAQKLLADAVCKLVHGDEILSEVNKAKETLFKQDLTSLDQNQLKDALKEAPCVEIKLLDLKDKNIVDFLVEVNAAKSKGEARRLIANKGAYLNNQVISDLDYKISSADILKSKSIIIRIGKKSFYLVNIID